MSKRKLEKTVLHELRALNDTIDEKIIKGLSYSRESRRHKFLLSSLSQLRKADSRGSWFVRSFSLSSFIF